MQLRDHARVGHHARVGGQQAGHVLPQADLDGAERAAEQRRGQIGAAATERSDRARLAALVAVGARRRAQEAGNDRHDARHQQRAQDLARGEIREHEVRRRATEGSVGDHHVDGIDVAGARAGGVERRCHQTRRQPLAAREHEVAGARGELAEHEQTAQQAVELVEGAVELVDDLLSRRAWRHQPLCELAVASAQRAGVLLEIRGFSGDGAAGKAQQCVGNARRRRHDDCSRRLARPDDGDGVLVRRRVRERRAPELVDLDSRSLRAHFQGEICTTIQRSGQNRSVNIGTVATAGMLIGFD